MESALGGRYYIKMTRHNRGVLQDPQPYKIQILDIKRTFHNPTAL